MANLVSDWDPSYLEGLDFEYTDLMGYNFKVLKHERISQAIVKNGFYESAQTKLLNTVLRIGGNYLDIGANIGYYTMLMSRLGLHRSFVHSFEPNPLAFAILSDNVRSNNVPSVTLNNLAVGREDETIRIDLALPLPSSEVEAKKYNLGGFSLRKKAAGEYPVRMVKIDSYVDEKRLEDVSFIKIDVEGFERNVLLGAKDTLRKKRPVIMLEFNAPNEARHDDVMDIIEYLRSLKYELAKIERKPVAHLRRLLDTDVAEHGFGFYVFAFRRSLDFLP